MVTHFHVHIPDEAETTREADEAETTREADEKAQERSDIYQTSGDQLEIVHGTTVWVGMVGDDQHGQTWKLVKLDVQDADETYDPDLGSLGGHDPDLTETLVTLSRTRTLPDQVWEDLKDPEVAKTCGCSCHPRAADVGIHDGGRSCPCQKTPEERKKTVRQLRENMHELGARMREQNTAWENAARERLDADTGFTWKIYTWAAPLQIVGTVDQNNFYFRERHETWSLENMGDQNSLDGEGTVIAEGTTRDWAYDTNWLGDLLEQIAVVMRQTETQKTCQHVGARLYCPDCGTYMNNHPNATLTQNVNPER